jgi:two-component system, OmpR family, response regulator
MSTMTSGGSTRVLVVDDEENITFLLGSDLRHFGFDVTTAATGRQGLDAVRGSEFDLVLLDVMLPDLDGFEVCRRMRQDGGRVPVLFLTARDATEDRVRGLTLGGDDYAHTVRRAGAPIDLSPTGYKLLRFLLANAGRVLSRAQILDHVWEYDFSGNTSVVDTYISYLRKKVDRHDPPLIQTIRGVGYSLRST